MCIHNDAIYQINFGYLCIIHTNTHTHTQHTHTHTHSFLLEFFFWYCCDNCSERNKLSVVPTMGVAGVSVKGRRHGIFPSLYDVMKLNIQITVETR